MPGEQMLVNSTSNINSRIVRQSNSQSRNFGGNGLGYANAIRNVSTRAKFTVQPRFQGSQLQNANSNNSYDVRLDDLAQRNGSNYGSRTNGSGQSSFAQCAAQKNKVGEILSPLKYASRFPELSQRELQLAPNRGRSVYKVRDAAAAPTQQLISSFGNAMETGNSRFANLNARESNLSVNFIRAPHPNQQKSERGVSKNISSSDEIPIDRWKYGSCTDSRFHGDAVHFPLTCSARVAQGMSRDVPFSRSTFQDVSNAQTSGQGFAANCNAGAVAQPVTAARNSVQSDVVSLSTQCTTAWISKPVDSAFQHYTPNATLVTSSVADATEIAAAMHHNQYKRLSNPHDRNIAKALESTSTAFSFVARSKVSKQEGFVGGSLPRIVICYSPNSQTTSNSNFQSSKSNARMAPTEEGLIELARPPQQMQIKSALTQILPSTFSAPLRQVIVKNDKPSKTPYDPAHIDEALTNTIRKASLLAEQQEAISALVSNNSGQRSVEPSPTCSSPSGAIKQCRVKSSDSAFEIARKNLAITTKGNSLSKPDSHSQSGVASLNSWFKSTQTSSLTMHVVGNYPSPIIISKLPKVVSKNKQTGADVNTSVIKSRCVDIAQTSPLSNSTTCKRHIEVVDLTTPGMKPSYMQAPDSSVVSKADALSNADIAMPSNSTTLLKTSVSQVLTPNSPVILSKTHTASEVNATMLSSVVISLTKTVLQRNVTQPQNQNLNSVTDHNLAQTETPSFESDSTNELPLDYSMTTLRKLECSFKNQMQEEPIDLSLPKIRQLTPQELETFTMGESIEPGLGVPSYVGPGQFHVPALVDQAAAMTETANLDTLCSVALGLSYGREKEPDSESSFSLSTASHGNNSLPKSSRAVTQPVECVTQSRKSTRLAEKYEKKRGEHLSIKKDSSCSVALQSSLVSTNVRKTVEAFTEDGIAPCLELSGDSREKEASIQEDAENESQAAQKSRMRKHGKKPRKTQEKGSPTKRKPIVLTIFKRSGSHLLCKQTCRKAEVSKFHLQNPASTEKRSAKCVERAGKACAGVIESPDVPAESVADGLKQQRAVRDESLETASISQVSDFTIAKTMQVDGKTSTNAVSPEKPQNDATQGNDPRCQGSAVGSKFVDTSSATRNDDEMKGECSGKGCVKNIVTPPDKLENCMESGENGEVCDETSQVESNEKKQADEEVETEASQAQLKERVKPLTEKDVNQSSSSENLSGAVNGESNGSPVKNGTFQEEIASKAKQHMPGVVVQKTALRGGILKGRNSPNMSLGRLNSDEIKSDFSVISGSELINITPNRMDKMINAKENMITGWAALPKRSKAEAVEIGNKDRSSQEEISDLKKHEDITAAAKQISSRKNDDHTEASTKKTKADGCVGETQIVFFEKDVPVDEKSGKSEVNQVVTKIKVPEMTNEIKSLTQTRKSGDGELNTEMSAGSASKDKSIDVDRDSSQASCKDDLSMFKRSDERQKDEHCAGTEEERSYGEQKEEIRTRSVVKEQMNRFGRDIEDNVISCDPVSSNTEKDVTNAEVDVQKTTIFQKTKRKRDVGGTAREASPKEAKRRRVDKVKKVSTLRGKLNKAPKKTKQLNFARLGKPTDVESTLVIGPILGHKKRGFDSNSSSPVAKKRTQLKLGYNTNAGWTGGELKIKRRKLIRKENNSSTVDAVPTNSTKKSALTYILLSDSSDSSEEGSVIISTTKVKKRVKRKERTGLETSSSLPKSTSGESKKFSSATPVLDRVVDAHTPSPSAVGNVLPATAETDKGNACTNSMSLVSGEEKFDVVAVDRNSANVAREDLDLLFEENKPRFTVIEENNNTVTIDTHSEKPKTQGKSSDATSTYFDLKKLSNQSQVFAVTQKPTVTTCPISPVFSGRSSIIIRNAAAKDISTRNQSSCDFSFSEEDTFGVQSHNSYVSASEDSDKPKPAAIRLKSFVLDRYTPRTDDLSDASYTNNSQFREKTQRRSDGGKTKKQDFMPSKRVKRIGGLITQKRKRLKNSPLTLNASERIKNQKANANSTNSNTSSKGSKESLRNGVDAIVRVTPTKKLKSIIHVTSRKKSKSNTPGSSKAAKRTLKRLSKAKGRNRSTIRGFNSRGNPSGKRWNEPSVLSSNQKERQSLRKIPMARIRGKWKTHQWPDVTKVAYKPLPFHQPEVITKEEREDNIFMAMQKLLKMGVITDQRPRIAHATARKSAPTAKKQVFVQVKPQDVKSMLPERKNELSDMQSSVHCILGKGVIIKPCSIVVKKLNIQRNTVRLIH